MLVTLALTFYLELMRRRGQDSSMVGGPSHGILSNSPHDNVPVAREEHTGLSIK